MIFLETFPQANVGGVTENQWAQRPAPRPGSLTPILTVDKAIVSRNDNSNSKPVSPPVLVDNVPHKLKAFAHWVCCWEVPTDETRKKKWTKVLKNPRTGWNAKSNDANTWGTFDEALASYQKGDYDGIGYVFADDDPFTGIDLDQCIDPVTGNVAEWAREIITKANSYTEESPSGTGVKIFIQAKLDATLRKRKG